jgi:hypothetical protein
MPLLNIFGELETLIADHLYPYRYVITPILMAALLGGAYAAYRMGLHRIVLRNPLPSAAIGVPLTIVALVAGNYFLSPLWERSFLEEESPLAAAPVATAAPTVETMSGGGSSDGGAQMAAFMASTAYSGMFRGADDFHFGRGDALIIETEPGKYVLRFENFSVRNGPDLYVYLSEDPNGKDVKEVLNLGRLKATDGAFNYEIPAGVDVSKIKSAIVWCKQFSTLFAHATLMEA